jgi:hypothetical protein
MPRPATSEPALHLLNQMHRSELRAEQLRIHLRSLQRTSAEARAVTAELVALDHQIELLRDRCRAIDPFLLPIQSNSGRLH